MRLSRDAVAVLLSTVAVVVVVTLGFWKTRGPSTQRLIRADEKRLQILHQLANEMNDHYKIHDKQLPDSLSDMQKAKYVDPITAQPFAYTPKPPNRYSLCATFATSGPKEDRNRDYTFWSHPAGLKCFEFNADEAVPGAPYLF
ncbi:MAG TPA: hypothetical protein VMH20_08215 [Verrucomicrobiae bacterium]|nr:hypothetical protein [Verrucomicrobiae bacterium]